MRPRTHTVVATLLLCAATIAYTRHMPEFGLFFLGHNDFLPRYTQGRMVGTGRMYDVEAGYQEQDRTVGFHVADRYHDRLPWQALLLALLGRLPYLPAYWMWVGLNLACFAILIRFWLLPRDYVLWGAVFFPAAVSIIVGQDSLMAAACMLGVLLLANRGRDISAGLLLALCTMKPHLFLLVPVALAAQRRWRLLGSAIAGTLGLLAVSTAVAGLDWVPQLIAIVRLVGRDSSLGVALRPSLFQFGINSATITAAAFLAIAICAAIWRMRTLEASIAVAMLGSILLAPHTSVYDLPLLLVALPALPLGRYGHWLRIALLTPVPYWALLHGSPWNACLPLLLLAIIAASTIRGAALPSFARHDSAASSGFTSP
jgi:hypothetical protein